MKKILSCITLIFFSMTSAYAGTMGEEKPLPVLIPFFDGEVMYTSPQIEGFFMQVNGVGTFRGNEDRQGWGGRLAVGALHPFTERWAGSAEFGWGYYGGVDVTPQLTLNNSGLQVTPTGNALNFKLDQYGVDLLAGVFYTQPRYDLFFKVGALVQNLRFTAKVTPNQLFANNTSTITQRLNGTYTTAATIANVLPALRLGGGYHLSDNWLFTVSWFHAFGSALALSAPDVTRNTGAGVGSLGSIVTQLRAPTIDSVLFGFDYRFM